MLKSLMIFKWLKIHVIFIDFNYLGNYAKINKKVKYNIYNFIKKNQSI